MKEMDEVTGSVQTIRWWYWFSILFCLEILQLWLSRAFLIFFAKILEPPLNSIQLEDHRPLQPDTPAPVTCVLKEEWYTNHTSLQAVWRFYIWFGSSLVTNIQHASINGGLSDFSKRHNFQMNVSSFTGGFESWLTSLMQDNW